MSLRAAIEDEKRLREAGEDDHPYGPWTGGSKASGGRPGKPGGGEALKRVKGSRAPYSWDDGLHQAEKEAKLEEYLKTEVFAGKWDGPPNSIEIVSSTQKSQERIDKNIGWSSEKQILYRGDEGKPVGYARLSTLTPPPGIGAEEFKSIDLVTIFPAHRGKGYGIKMYDHIQDRTTINLYDHIGTQNAFTTQGKAFATKWLEHRIALESAT